jgi:hypothetical protein
MFDAARDLVFTNSADGNTIMSGGYRISKILGGAKKSQRGGRKKKEGDEEMENFYKEESGIPMGLLFFGTDFFEQGQGHGHGHAQHAQKKESDFHTNDSDSNSIAAIGELELIMSPQSPQSSSHIMIVGDGNSCVMKEDARELESQEVDQDLFQILLDNALIDQNADNNLSSMTRKRRANFSNLKNLKVDKVYMRSKTRRHKK